jgi:CPA2 family monovalent cation:H+ antiporter-2
MEFAILKDIVIIFALSVGVNLVFNRLKIPTIVGYLMTGIIAGPYLLSLVEGRHQIELMAEIGVALLLFTIGLEFSLKHFIRIRRIVFVGGILQVGLTATIFWGLFQIYEPGWQTGLFFGFLIALSSSALVLKLLQERSELTSNYGHTVLGILIFQDILLVPLLLFTNLIGSEPNNLGAELIKMSIKAVIIIALVYAGNKYLLPKLLHIIAMARSQELFMISIFLICFSIALLTAELGMSLAFGAFLAGLMISESEYSHSAFGNILPFKDTFSSFFFVSIGMLLDLNFVVENYLLVIAAVFLVILLKFIIAGTAGFLLGHTFRGFFMVGIALSQVGEFSFILAKVGFNKSLLSEFFYQLFLAVAIITMALTPFLLKIARPLTNRILKFPLPEFLVEGIFPLKEVEIPDMKNHLVIIGMDATALKLSLMARYYNLNHISIIFDPAIAREKMNNGDTVVYGDAVNEPILHKAHVDTAEIVVISIGRIIPSMAITGKVREINKNAFIVVRTRYLQSVKELYDIGANQVVPEKLEIAINFFNRILIKKLYPRNEITRILHHIRDLNLGELKEHDLVNRPTAWDELENLDISAVKVEKASIADGKSIKELKLREKSKVTLLAIKRGEEILEHPSPRTKIQLDDIVYLLGKPEDIINSNEVFQKSREYAIPDEFNEGPD